jgi:hypothetical protein
MNFALIALKYWKYGVMIALAVLLAITYNKWQRTREEVGVQKRIVVERNTENLGLRNQLTEANNKINSTAKKGAVSYGQCQDLVANDAAKNFDTGVAFGRATCPAITPLPPASSH